ncbi:hypothetical protein ABZ754_26675 [Micromonospora purpureochromogenes]|uniref:hypothetical protein n=1 Tax=Micromonospora purpureochromogenes TaxID=47872 RepID=UPI0033EDE7FF
MTMTWVILGAVGAVVAAAVGWVAWRDRERTASAENRVAGQAAFAEQQRYEAARHATQGHVTHRGHNSGSW